MTRSVRLATLAVAVLACVGTSLSPALADGGPGHGGDDHDGGHGGQHGHDVASIPLPNGFAPEDITAGRHHTFYVGSLATGAIYRGSFRSTTGSVLVPSATGPTTGLYYEDRHDDAEHAGHTESEHHHGSHARHGSHGRHDRLWAAGGPSGQAREYDATTGALLHTWQLAAANSGSFVSDVVVTRDAAYYTDAFQPKLYVIDLRGSDAGTVRTLALSGDVAYQGNGAFNLNGLAVVRGWLVSGQTVTGNLYAIDPSTGRTKQVPLVDRAGNPTTVPGADGIAQRGTTLYIAQNFPQKLATVKLERHLRRARLVAQVTSPLLDIPSSVEEDRGDLYGLNARFGSPNTADKTYSVVRVGRN